MVYIIRLCVKFSNHLKIGELSKTMKKTISEAAEADIAFLQTLEEQSFQPFQRTAPRNIKHSLSSDSQTILIAFGETKKTQSQPLGAMVLIKYRRTLRIYSIAVLPEFQQQGVGSFLLKHAMEFANRNQYHRISIEVDADNEKLVEWYKKHGFEIFERKENYYAEGKDAFKMELHTQIYAATNRITNVIVMNHPYKWDFADINAKAITVKEYISNPIYSTYADFRIFNLCSSYEYQSYGYYVSLLATARGQRVIPNNVTLRDFKMPKVVHSVSWEIQKLIETSLGKETGDTFSLDIYFGQTAAKEHKLLASKLYQLFEAPLFKVNFLKHQQWIIKDIQLLTLNKIPKSDMELLHSFAEQYFSKKRFNKTKLSNFKYDIAVLVNPEEKTPPSCPKALKKFKEAANRKGLYVEHITRENIDRLNEFDALFIRETTGVNNYTYEFSRMAYAEGLIVIDDPWSILRCSNKIYQNETFKKHRILTPQTEVLTKNFFQYEMLNDMKFPLVLKQPDSSFSLGVAKVDNVEQATKAISELFKNSDMIICQEFLYSEFDWRIGVLDNKPLFACKYFMSKGHWQIYNWKSKKETDKAGLFETLNIEDVPQAVLQTAIKAASLIGDGLYGVDLKMVNGKVYVVEVNDNPNIDSGVEDKVLGNKLYDKLVESFYNRIEIAKNIQRISFQ